ELRVEERTIEGEGEVDVFTAIADMGIPLVFKPLESALGFFLPAPLNGILVTTKRSRHIQRFTAAHELGHAFLGHKGSIDNIVFGSDLPFDDSVRGPQEV